MKYLLEIEVFGAKSLIETFQKHSMSPFGEMHLHESHDGDPCVVVHIVGEIASLCVEPSKEEVGVSIWCSSHTFKELHCRTVVELGTKI